MNQKVSSVSPVEVGIASGIIGSGVGYVMAPRKYNLEQLLTQSYDVFESAVPRNVILKQSDTHKNAYKVLAEARASLARSINAGKSNLVELVKTPYVESAYNNIKNFIPKSRVSNTLLCGSIATLVGFCLGNVTKN